MKTYQRVIAGISLIIVLLGVVSPLMIIARHFDTPQNYGVYLPLMAFLGGLGGFVIVCLMLGKD